MARTTARERRWATQADTAEYAGVSTRTLIRWERSGRIRGYRGSRKVVRYDLGEIDALFEGGAA